MRNRLHASCVLNLCQNCVLLFFNHFFGLISAMMCSTGKKQNPRYAKRLFVGRKLKFFWQCPYLVSFKGLLIKAKLLIVKFLFLLSLKCYLLVLPPAHKCVIEISPYCTPKIALSYHGKIFLDKSITHMISVIWGVFEESIFNLKTSLEREIYEHSKV